ncbi:MAG TPA: DUF1330 domain-containing protein [Solirubrobacterales bacterium]
MAIEPDEAQVAELTALAESDDDGPLVMLNLNRYRDREAYGRYGLVALRVLERVGGRILWHAQAEGTVVGGDAETYDEVIAVWYPSAAAFIALATDPETLEARRHRVAGLERAALIRCEAGAEPALGIGNGAPG